MCHWQALRRRLQVHSQWNAKSRSGASSGPGRDALAPARSQTFKLFDEGRRVEIVIIAVSRSRPLCLTGLRYRNAVSGEPGQGVRPSVRAGFPVPLFINKDTHNLGKTTLGRLLDFSFLAGREPKFFLFKHLDLFKDFIFFLEIELTDASYLTVRRGVEEASKISFKKHEARYQDFSTIGDGGWDHFELPFDRAREMLDSLLDWRALKPWEYRKELGRSLVRMAPDRTTIFGLWFGFTGIRAETNADG